MAGEILSGVGSIIGGLAAGTGAIGSIVSANQSWKRQKRAMDYQHKLAIEAYERELADSRDYFAIVEAANKAGINPLVALGQSAGGGSISATSVPGEDSLPSTIANAGASVGSAINGMTNGALLIQKQLEALDLENEGKKIDNAIQQKELDNKDEHEKNALALEKFNNEKAEAEAIIAKNDAEISTATVDQQKALVLANLRQLSSLAESAHLDVEAKRVNLETLREMNNGNLALLKGQLSHLTAQGWLELVKIIKADEHFYADLSQRQKEAIDKWNSDLRDYYLEKDKYNSTNYMELFSRTLQAMDDEILTNTIIRYGASWMDQVLANAYNEQVWNNIYVPNEQNPKIFRYRTGGSAE